jgi:hypothetical protein
VKTESGAELVAELVLALVAEELVGGVMGRNISTAAAC